MSNLFISLEQYRAMRKKQADANVLQIARKLLRPEDLKIIEAEEMAGALSTPPQGPVTPASAITAGEAPKCETHAHEEIPLHELDSDVLGLDPLDENDARLMDAIIEAKRAKALVLADSMPPCAEAIARKFVGLGGHVIFFPRGTKRCTHPGWQQRATNDLQAALAWAHEDPNANVGIVGKSNGLWALDDDAGVVAEYEQAHGKIPTYCTLTVSGGRHFIFRQNDLSRQMGNVTVKDGAGRELLSARVDNRYVVAAGSWAHPHNDTTMPLKQYKAVDANAPVIDAPASLIDFIKTKAGGRVDKTETEIIDAATTEVHEGGRNNFLTRLAGKMRQHFGWDTDKIEQELLQENVKKCKPPLLASEVESIAHSIGKKPVKPGDLILNQVPDVAVTAASDDWTKNWRNLFRTIGEMEDRPIDMIIDGVLQEGICFIGAGPGDGKTLIALSMAKAITTGSPFLGLPQHKVQKARQVLYLIPETRDPAFRMRAIAFGIPDDETKFLSRTISMGATLELSHPGLLEGVRQTKAVVFLDTAIRFMTNKDENAAAQNRQLFKDVLELSAAGACCVVLLHHATKASKEEVMTLENMLRGTSDFAAMCDQAYGVRKDGRLYANGSGPMEIDVVNLKDREQIGALTELRLAASYRKEGCILPVSHINEAGDFKVVLKEEARKRDADALVELIKANPTIPEKEISAMMPGWSKYAIGQTLGWRGWHRVQGGRGGASPWHQDGGQPCPYAKPEPKKKRNIVTLDPPESPTKVSKPSSVKAVEVEK